MATEYCFQRKYENEEEWETLSYSPCSTFDKAQNEMYDRMDEDRQALGVNDLASAKRAVAHFEKGEPSYRVAKREVSEWVEANSWEEKS